MSGFRVNENRADEGLLPYASLEAASRGRRYPESGPGYRGEYERDRDRIVHCTAFRRLVYKTQVFVNHEGDLYRTRLTHSLEVAQIGRSVARRLRLNEPLAEAICLAHDLGHTPFGHAGQDALNACMRDYGGFEHNLQSLRVVDELEERYAEFPGLNLTFECREGILKHCSARNAATLGELGRRFLERRQPSLEAQIANVADEIAYNAHDIDDGLRAGLITLAQLNEVPLFDRWRLTVLADHPALAAKPNRRLLFETLRRLLSAQVHDLVATTEAALAEHRPVDSDAARSLPPLVRFSPGLHAQNAELKRFLFSALYRHPQVTQSTDLARTMVSELYAAYHARPDEMPADYAAAANLPRSVADYIAGMTDRYAQREHHRLTGRRLFAD